MGIESFPEIRLYSIDEVGKYEKYDGELEQEELQNWVKKRLHKKMRKNGLPVPGDGSKKKKKQKKSAKKE